MKSKLWVSLLLFVFAVPAVAQVSDTYVIPAAINASGANNSRWATDFHLFNPQAHTLRVTLTFLPSGGAVGSTVKFNVSANGTAYADNILDDVFDLTGTGSLLVATFAADNPGVPDQMLDRAFLVNTRTYNISGTGTYGQSIPGGFYGLQDVDADGITGVSTGIRNTSTGTSGFRTNVGAVNLGRYSITMYVSVFDSAGNAVGDRLAFSIPPQAHVQDRLPVAVEHGSVEFYVDDPMNDAVVFPYASVIDNRSNDPVYVAPVLLASPGRLLQSAATRAAAATATPRRLSNNEAADVAARAADGGSAKVDAAGRLIRASRD